MDIHQRKTSPFPEDIQAVLIQAQTEEHLPRASQPRIHLERVDLEKKIIPGYFELDFNRHVSNQYFFRWMLEPFSIDFLLNHQISELNVKIKGEVFADEKIASQIQFSDLTTTKHMLSKEGEIVATGIAKWVKKT
jgi:acyl-ACP thioesterase